MALLVMLPELPMQFCCEVLVGRRVELAPAIPNLVIGMAQRPTVTILMIRPG